MRKENPTCVVEGASILKQQKKQLSLSHPFPRPLHQQTYAFYKDLEKPKVTLPYPVPFTK